MATAAMSSKSVERTLVYGNQLASGQFSTSLCSETKRVEDAKEDLAYLEHIPRMRDGAPVSGDVSYWDRPPGATETSRQPVRDAVVELDGEGRHYRATVDEHGKFKFPAVSAGTYRRIVRTAIPFRPDTLEATIAVNDPRGCMVDTIIASRDRRATGRVIDEFDRPVAGARAALEPVSNPGGAAGIALTAADGSFEMSVEVSLVRLRVTLFEGVRNGANPNRYCDGEGDPIPITFDDIDVDLGTCRVKRGN